MSSDYQTLDEEGAFNRPVRRKFRVGMIAMFSSIILTISVLIFAFFTSNDIVVHHPTIKLFNNARNDVSTETVLMISIDGVRAEYIDRGYMPNLEKLANEGIMADGMIPVFPSLTFPNHYTIATGLYPYLHGIVNNEFYDPSLNETFSYKKPNQNEGKWWGGEPIWNTVQKHGMTSGVYFWPGAEVSGKYPNYYVEPYNETIPNHERLKTVLEWLDKPRRPSFLGMYISDVDTAGHNFGPNSFKVNKALERVDNVIGLLISELKKRNLYEKVHIMIVSDHGMTELSDEKIVFLDELVNMGWIERSDTGPFVSIWPKKNKEEIVYQTLYEKSLINNHFSVFKKEYLPKRYHYKDNQRIAPIIVLCDLGWLMMKRSVDRPSFNGMGTHGYNPTDKDMHALFVAKGPKFVKNSNSFKIPENRIPSFRNLDLYRVVTRVLEIDGSPTNGTDTLIRLILQ